MTASHSTPGGVRRKGKASQVFPLFLHKGSGQWAKKVKGKRFYFGTDKNEALRKWVDEKDHILLTGRKKESRNVSSDSLTVDRLANLFLESRDRKVKTGELAQRTYDDYQLIAKRFIDYFGRPTVVEYLTPSDFAKYRAELAKGCNLKTLETLVAKTRAILNYADKNALLDVPLSRIWGQEFTKPSRASLAKLRNAKTRLYEAEEIRRLIDAANPQLRAMIFLGLNCAFGNNDCAKLKFANVDLSKGWLSFPRPKTGVARRCSLWPETVKAIQAYLKIRKKPTDKKDSDKVFITSQGGRWEASIDNKPLTKEFTKLRKSLDITTSGKTFYALRHTFQTVGDETRDFVAVSSIMGHCATSISDHYREKISDERLKAVADHVRSWLFPTPVKRKQGAKKQAKTIVG